MERYAVGKITGCFGIRGDLKVHPTTHSIERLRLLATVAVGNSDGATVQFNVERVVIRDSGVVIRLEGISDRNAAENLVGKFMFVDANELDTPSTGEYFIHEIVGCEVYSTDGNRIGTVESVEKFPAQDLWSVRDGLKLHLIPAVKEFIREVDLVKRRITINVIEGLIEGV